MRGGPAIERLADRLGIEASYRDIAGVERVVSAGTRTALLRAMGLDIRSDPDANDALARLDAESMAAVDIICRQGDPIILPDTDGRARWTLVLEDGATLSGQGPGLPPLDIGVHALTVETESGPRETTLIVTPPARPAKRGDGRPIWGVTTALYGLRSDRNLGLGDYEDLAAAAESVAGIGADFIGVNPVHALSSGDAAAFSPYSPSHRSFLNVAHIAVDAVPEFSACEPARRWLSDNRAAMDTLRQSVLIDYPAAALPRHTLLEMLFDRFEAGDGGETARRDEFEAYLAGQGDALAQFALFEAIAEHHGARWTEWPAEMQDSANPAVRAFAGENAARVRYHAWLQWLADSQLEATQARAQAAGMALGLYLDIAVGVRPDGAEVWADRALFAHGVSLGAPPDAFNEAGQNWSLAPWSPQALRRKRYRPFAATLRAAVRRAGIIRIDHVLGLNRGFWVPGDGTPGGYVRYPAAALFAVLAIEAHRAGCMVVGEDLGNVPHGFRDRLEKSGIHGCSVFQFERGADGAFRPARDYRAATLASLGTHDLPTLRGYWTGHDIESRQTAGLIDADQATAEQAQREEDRLRILRVLENEGLLPAGSDDPAALGYDGLAAALHSFLDRTPAALRAVQLDDALGVTEQQNMPGTIDEYPNWRRRLPVSTGALADQDLLVRIAAIMNRAEQREERKTAP